VALADLVADPLVAAGAADGGNEHGRKPPWFPSMGHPSLQRGAPVGQSPTSRTVSFPSDDQCLQNFPQRVLIHLAKPVDQ